MCNFRVLVFALLLILTPEVQSNEQMSVNVNKVNQFVAAFNAQDSHAMVRLVVDEVEWISIVSNETVVEVRGKNKLIESMGTYFKSCSTCRSELSEMIATTSRVSAIEVASWQGKSGLKSQRAISVYEFSDGLITRVYYFPSEK
ncbi:nuclear transport factor 2 family protein [Shewanella sp. TC10]|uniref:nuclear transport factor 2 family protein n=1 Tax=Shewanella sp. TC10 TaxID=1419739 RepID=UPI00129DE84B|nr:nuclear transport factor 2 family protein [Shewanella sp. TC10]